MVFDNIYSKYWAPKRKKCNAWGWIIGIILFLSLVPLAVRHDRKKGEWGFASLLLYLSCRPSGKDPGRRELTLSIPGFTHLKSIYCDSGAIRPGKRAATADIDEADDLLDVSEDENDTDPRVVITEGQE